MVKYRKSYWGRPNYVHERSRWWNSPEIGTGFLVHGNRIPIVSHCNTWFFLPQFRSSDDVPKPEDLEESLFINCHCKSCDPGKCQCQYISDIVDVKGKKAFAYDKDVCTCQISCLHYYSYLLMQGLFAIDVAPGLMVIECNKVRHPHCASLILIYIHSAASVTLHVQIECHSGHAEYRSTFSRLETEVGVPGPYVMCAKGLCWGCILGMVPTLTKLIADWEWHH